VTVLDWREVKVSVWEPAAGVGAQVVLLALLAAGAGLYPVALLVGAAYAVIVCGVLAGAMSRSRTPLGPAGRVTLTRAVLVGGVTALVTMNLIGRETPVAFLVALAAVALALDAVDGHVARRTGTESALGARFDMEIDAFLILVLSVNVSRSLGAWVLLIGLMRYGFAAAAWVAPWLRAPLPPSFARKTVAAAQGILLVAVSSGLFPPLAALALAGLALGSLSWSFGRDILWLWRNRPAHAISSPLAESGALAEIRQPYHQSGIRAR
jgi:phosphatidylglycerophosphate synthase